MSIAGGRKWGWESGGTPIRPIALAAHPSGLLCGLEGRRHRLFFATERNKALAAKFVGSITAVTLGQLALMEKNREEAFTEWQKKLRKNAYIDIRI